MPAPDTFNDQFYGDCTNKVRITKTWFKSLSERNHSVRAAWYKATSKNISNYKTNLENRLNNLQYNNDIFLSDNVFCTDHKNDICALYNNIIQCVIDTEKDNIPTTSLTNKKTVPGWTEHVGQYQQVALYLHTCWKDEGRPHQGETSRMH